MRKIIYIAGLCLSTMFSSCEDFLTVESPDQLTSDSFWRNEADAQAGIAAVYSQLENSLDTWEFSEIKWPVEAYREDIIELGKDAMNYPNWVELGKYTYTNGNSQITSYWRNNYRGISFANQVLEKVPLIPEGNISEEIRNQIINEAYFLRAYYHLKLLLNWEKIIVRDNYIDNENDLDKELSERNSAWEFIISDLTKATSLPESYSSENVGRATKAAAYAYLGFSEMTRAYENSLDRKGLEAALSALDNVKGYELENDFVSMFNGSNKNSSESIFELQFSLSTANGADYGTQMHRWIGCNELLGWDEIRPSEILINEFKKEGTKNSDGLYDQRYYETLFTKCEYFNDNTGKVYGKNYDDWFSSEVYAFRKFMPADLEGLENSRCAINIPLMRYSNVLLMKAEILNQLDRGNEGLKYINNVREKHGKMPAVYPETKDEIQAQIEHERMLEFVLENWRWYDLRRWGKLSSAIGKTGRENFDESKHSFYPIPLTEINSNNKLQ